MEDDLRHLLEQLQAAIERTRAGDEDREELARLVEEVERRLRGEPEPEPERHGLTASLQEATVRFEADHPLLGAALRRAVDALSAAGI